MSRAVDGHVEAGIYPAGRVICRLHTLGSLATVFHSEICAILEAARMEEAIRSKEDAVCTCSDSLAALKASNPTRNMCLLVQECGEALGRLAEEKELVLARAPGHIRIPGSDWADRLAKTAAREHFLGPEPA